MNQIKLNKTKEILHFEKIERCALYQRFKKKRVFSPEVVEASPLKGGGGVWNIVYSEVSLGYKTGLNARLC